MRGVVYLYLYYTSITTCSLGHPTVVRSILCKVLSLLCLYVVLTLFILLKYSRRDGVAGGCRLPAFGMHIDAY